MKLFFGGTFIEIQPNDNSKAVEKVRAVDTFTVYFSAPGYVDIPVGAWTTFEGKRYELLNPKNFKKHNTRNFEYTLVLEDDAGKLRRYKYRDSTTRRLKFEYTARPHEFIEMLVYNLNKRDPGWTVGDCIEAVEKHVAFNHTDCFNALEQIADAFSTEWEIENKRISLRKVEYFKDNPLPLSYGKGNGFKPGVGQANQDKKSPVEILFPQGSTRNIDASTYGSTELLLPKSQIIGFDGANYYYDPSEVPAGREVRWYITDADGFSVSRKDKAFVTFAEESLDCSHIYPSRVGTISSVVVVDAQKHLYDIIDTSIPSDLDFSKCLIQGSTLTIIPQEGMLAGKEFDAKYIHADRRFEIVPQDLDGRTMPDETFKPLVGQKYAVFGMMMPGAYICDNPSHTGASWDMLRESVRFFFDNEHPHFSCTAELDSIFAQKDWINIGGRIRKGAFIQFSDPQFQPEGAGIRIVTVTRPVNTPKKPKIELSNMTVSSSIVGELNKITENEVIAENQYRDALQFTKRRFRDTEEHLGLIEQAVQGYEKGINPAWVKTMAILLGDASLQFQFIARLGSMDAIGSGIQYDPATKKLTAPAGIIQHQTLRITTLAPNHEAKEYMHWTLPAFESEVLYEAVPLYVYAKCHKDTSANGDYFVGMGEIFLSEEAHDFDNTDGNYYLLIGTLSSGYDGDRSYMECYGFAEMSPSQFIVNLIRSVDGKTFFNLRDSIIGGNIHFTATDGTSKSVAEYADETNAITDNFTKIAGGLILTTLIKMMSGDTETGGLSANLDNILLWGGGTYEQALQNLAKTILRHDGSGQFAAGNFAWDTQGNIILKSNSSGVSVVIDPVGRRLYMTNSGGKIIGEWSFAQEYGSNINLTDPDDGDIYTRLRTGNLSIGNPRGDSYYGGNNMRISSGLYGISVLAQESASLLEIILKGLPTNANSLTSGQLWRDNNGYLRIVP